MKKILYCLVLAVMLTACGGGSKKTGASQDEAPKKVGDIITVNGAEGVVFEVSADGQHGLVMSVLEGDRRWVKAGEWCSQYGEGWRLPSVKELKTIYEDRDVLNLALSVKGCQTLVQGLYWSSEQAEPERAWGVSMYSGSTYSDPKHGYDYVRAVSAF